MISKIITFLKVFFQVVGIVASIAVLLFLLNPAKFIDTIRFFPKFNPLSKSMDQKIKPVGQDMEDTLTESELRKTQLSMNDGSMRNVIIYLPKDYYQDGEKTYPTLYMLHGSPGQETDWLIEGGAKESLDSSIINKTLPPTIVIFPDGNGGVLSDTQYINSADGKQLDEDFIVKTVVDYVDTNLKTNKDPNYRTIGGLSSGGYGAINLALRHQDVFSKVLSLSGYGYIDKNILSNRLIQGSEEIIKENSPLDYIPNLTNTSTKFILIVGRNDKIVIDQNRSLETALVKKGFMVTLTIADGEHEWEFWKEHFPDGLLWLGRQS